MTNVRDRGRRRLVIASAGVGMLAVSGTIAVTATRAAPAHAATVPASTQQSSQQGTASQQSGQSGTSSVTAPQAADQGGGADAGSSGS